MTRTRWVLLLAPAVLLAACSGGSSHHGTAAPRTTASSTGQLNGTLVPPSLSPSPSPPTATAVPATPSPSPAPATQIVQFSPVDSTGKLKPGFTVSSAQTGTQCLAGSDTGANAYRCFSGHGVYDPCWLDTDDGTNHTVACISRPWSTQVDRITVPQFMGGALDNAVSRSPLALQLSDGERCFALQGAHEVFNGRVIDFACDQRAVLRPLHTQSSLWTADTATNAPGTVARYTAGPTMSVTTAWVAVASLTAPSTQ